ncbi:hypothetical protein BRADI_3g30765v3 [Brachypodium distachyon]|uniref:Uncharacterized protein n=1 Tax=Brachypodium distachyon TaxID=15368 RepID=A0A2K2D0A3_BRADI|nr:hypothetical protein BRADI_3g30765v3 [Brachypodium distachyon]
MPASRVMILGLCLMGLLLSPTSAEPPRPSPASSGVDGRWPLDKDLPVDTLTALPPGTTEDAAVDGTAAVPPSPPERQRPEARRALEHEARCGPRIHVRRGSPWPKVKPGCPDGSDAQVATLADDL